MQILHNMGGCYVNQLLCQRLRLLSTQLVKSLYHDARRSICQRSIADICMSCDPTDIGRAPVYILVFVVKDILECCGSIQHVSCLSVENSLWLACRSTEIIIVIVLITLHVVVQ